MRRLAPLVIRLLLVSLVAFVLADAGTGGDSTNVVKANRRVTRPMRPTPPLPRRKSEKSRRNKRRTTTTTTTTTVHPHGDDYDEPTTPGTTTTIDPRTFDHTDIGSCEVPLGMENGKISNESLSASSSYDQSVSPLSARIRKEIRGGAWCPNGLITSRSRQYLEINLHKEYLITATETQGRFANTIGVEFVRSYSLEFWRQSLNRWAKYQDFNGSRLIPGNVDTYTPTKSILEAPFVASKVRFFPFASHPRTACMRVELYGCLWKQPIVAYSAPKGGYMRAMTGGAKFEDLSYDGVMRRGRLLNGLGQITDSYIGPNDFEIADPNDTSGSRWVGWNKTMNTNNAVEVKFNFSGTRTMYYVDIHTNNMFTKDVQLFKEAQIYFSLEGERWQEDYVSYEPKQDKVSEHARTIHIALENRTAKHIKMKLKFQHEWILISEVIFKSAPIVVNYSMEFLDEYYRTEETPSRNERNSMSNTSVGLVCGGMMALGVFIGTMTVFLTKRIRRRLPDLFKSSLCPFRRRGNANARNNRGAPRLAMALANCPPIHMLRPAIVDEDYREPYNMWKETLGQRQAQDKRVVPDQNEYNEICEDNEFPRPYMMRRSEPQENFYAASDIIHHVFPEERYRRRERPIPGIFTSIKLPEAEPPNGVAPLLDFPRGRMRPVTFLGESLHGNIQICETDGIEELSDEETPNSTGHHHPAPAAAVSLSRVYGADPITISTSLCLFDRAAFAREATWGAGLKHPQLARVLGLSLHEPPCAALDRGDAAPLPTILKSQRKLNYSSLIHICCQIAAGMKYLERYELVHRDLAARNVTVTEVLNVKISDYAMFCDEFAGDYYIGADGLRLPLRWMPWESMLLGMYAPSSDVWAFGVTVWEVLTYCIVKPFDEMNDDQVVMNANEWRRGGRGARVPAAPPPRCRRELYDLMHECWRREPEQRPHFYDLHRYLERMTYGFQPLVSVKLC